MKKPTATNATKPTKPAQPAKPTKATKPAQPTKATQEPKELLAVAERLRQIALGHPETYEESPWGDRVVKVKGKIFVFCGVREGKLYVSVKLPHSSREALALSFVEPTGYGLGKSGWVTATLAKDAATHEARFVKWIDESYRALAPAKLLSSLSEPAKTKAKPPKPPLNSNAKPAAKPLRKRVLLLCHDPLRTERAQSAFAAHGLTVAGTTDAADVRQRLGKLDAVVIDLGRRLEEGITLATEIDLSDFAVSIFLVGLRDAAARRRAKELASADLFSDAPGDPEVVAAILAALR